MAEKANESLKPGKPPEAAALMNLEGSFKSRQAIVIGRGVECDVVVKDAKASRRHCRLTRQNTDFVLEDLGSKNGTFVDGVKITAPVVMKANQTFKIGDTMFYISL